MHLRTKPSYKYLFWILGCKLPTLNFKPETNFVNLHSKLLDENDR